MGSVFYRNPRHDYPVGVRGYGVYLYDADGKQYLDGSGGAAISCLGHGHPVVVEAIRLQVGRMAFAHTLFFTNHPQEQLAAEIAGRFGEDNARVYFLSGGSEANETAVKLARQYWLSQGRDQKHLVISRHQSYHGNTLGALSLSGNPVRRKVFDPLLYDWPRIDPCHAYRYQWGDESELEYGIRTANLLEDAIKSAGAENVAAFIAEPVVGATLGAVPAVEGYFQTIREICDRYEVLLILDEVMAGCGRTGSYFAFEADNVLPDMVTLAKGLAGGYQPLGAVVARGFIHRGIVEAYGAFSHGHSYVGHATATAAGLAVIRTVEKDDLLANVRQTGADLREHLRETFREHPHVGDIRGRGLLIGMELVQDRITRKGISRELGLATKIRNTAMENGLICYPGSGTADGVDGAHILLAPPFICQSQHVDELVAKLEKTLAQMRFV